MNYIEIITSKKHIKHYIDRYIRLVNSWINQDLQKGFDKHHILPKAKDFFPEYKNLKEHKWNQLNVSKRQHFILHLLLAKAFPKTSQTIAFYNMCNQNKKLNSKEYEISKLFHISKLHLLHKSKERNLKISIALRGKKKTKEHVEKMKGRVLGKDSIEKLRNSNKGKKRSQESIDKQFATRKLSNKSRIVTKEQKENMSDIKLSLNLKWYNDGKENKLFSDVPNYHWKLGRLGYDKQYVCPHCKHIGRSAAMFRWHFDNCKELKP